MIKNSIRNKLFLYVTLIFLVFVIAIFSFNKLFLPNFYLSQKRTVLQKQAEIMNSYHQSDYTEYYDAIEEMTLNSGTELIVYNNDGIVYESAMKRLGENYFHPNEIDTPIDVKGKDDKPRKFKWWENNDNLPITQEGTFSQNHDPEMQIESLIYKQVLDSGDIVAVRVIIGAIEDSVAISNFFLIMISSFFLVLALFITYYFSRRFTKPIIEMQQITTKLSELDFSKQYQVQSKDELGILGENINILSEKLNTSLSQLKVQNEQLTIELEKERQLDQLRKTFISNVSHELKTPLSIIEAYAEGLQLDVAKTKEKSMMYSDIILNETNHMTNLLDSILDLSQIEAGVLKLNNSSFSVKTQIKKLIQAHEVMLESKACQIIFQEPTQEDIVFADVVRIQQVVRNYLKNALIHAKEGTTITILEVVTTKSVRVAVQNIGVQLSDIEIKNSWNQFYKKDQARTIHRDAKQYGLGLSIVKGIFDLYADAHYGANRIENGMEFWFELPLEK